MNERAIKRLLFIVIASIVAIFLFKAVLIKTIVGANKATADKKQTADAKLPAQQQSPAPPADADALTGTPATSAASAATALDSPDPSTGNETH